MIVLDGLFDYFVYGYREKMQLLPLSIQKPRNPQDITRQADIIISAVGKPNMVRGSWIKPGAVIVDVGISFVRVSFFRRKCTHIDLSHNYETFIYTMNCRTKMLLVAFDGSETFAMRRLAKLHQLS